MSARFPTSLPPRYLRQCLTSPSHAPRLPNPLASRPFGGMSFIGHMGNPKGAFETPPPRTLQSSLKSHTHPSPLTTLKPTPRLNVPLPEDIMIAAAGPASHLVQALFWLILGAELVPSNALTTSPTGAVRKQSSIHPVTAALETRSLCAAVALSNACGNRTTRHTAAGDGGRERLRGGVQQLLAAVVQPGAAAAGARARGRRLGTLRRPASEVAMMIRLCCGLLPRWRRGRETETHARRGAARFSLFCCFLPCPRSCCSSGSTRPCRRTRSTARASSSTASPSAVRARARDTPQSISGVSACFLLRRRQCLRRRELAPRRARRNPPRELQPPDTASPHLTRSRSLRRCFPPPRQALASRRRR